MKPAPFHPYSSPKMLVVLASAIALAVAAVAQLMWGEYTRQRASSPRPASPRPARQEAPPLPAPGAFLQAGIPVLAPTNNLFHSAFIDAALRQIAARKAKEAADASARDALVQATPRTTMPPPPPIKEVKAPPRLLIQFQGVIHAGETGPFALLGFIPGKVATPYATGERYRGTTVARITENEVELVLGNGTTNRIAKGQRLDIPEDWLNEH